MNEKSLCEQRWAVYKMRLLFWIVSKITQNSMQNDIFNFGKTCNKIDNIVWSNSKWQIRILRVKNTVFPCEEMCRHKIELKCFMQKNEWSCLESDQTLVRLYRTILRDYESNVRPSIRHDMPVNITFSFSLTQLIDVVRFKKIGQDFLV